MKETLEALLRQLYLVPESPTVELTWQKWRDLGESATVAEVRQVLWAIPRELYTFRRFDDDTLMSVPPAIAGRIRKLYSAEDRLIEIWQTFEDPGSPVIIRGAIEAKFIDLLSAIQRKLADLTQEIGGLL